MLDKIKALQQEIKQLTASSAEEAEHLRIKYLSKKGIISEYLMILKQFLMSKSVKLDR